MLFCAALAPDRTLAASTGPGLADGGLVVVDIDTFAAVKAFPPDELRVNWPDSRYTVISLRGPNPVSAPHVAVGSTSGFSVVDIAAH